MAKKQYSEQFRRDAVALWHKSGKTKQEVADSLGIHGTTLGGWIKQYDIDTGERPGVTTDEQREIKRLRKELDEAQQTVKLLKKAAAFFAADELKNNKG
jgi:transposase